MTVPGKLRELDRPFVFATIALAGIGLLLIFSADNALEVGDHFRRQLIAAALGLMSIGIVIALPHRFFYASAYLAYAVGLLIIVLVLIMGEIGLGARRWLQIGGINFQPSEPAKLAYILAVARYLSDLRPPNYGWRTLLRVVFIALPFFFLIALQPDLGTATVIPVVGAAMLAWYGLPLKFFIFLGLPVISLLIPAVPLMAVPVVILGILWLVRTGMRWMAISLVSVICLAATLTAPVAWGSLEPYQQRRLVAFLNPQADPLGSGYQVIQSRVAIGSGGLSGIGYLQGTQTQLRFLPQQHTDFIFSLAGEEFGFIGTTVIIALYFIFGWRGITVAAAARNQFLSLTAFGVVVMIVYHMLVNIGMTLGHLPVTGLPLPFLSYGGSFLITCLTAAGLIITASINKRAY